MSLIEISSEELKKAVEVLLFAAPEPVNVAGLMSALSDCFDDSAEFRPMLVEAISEIQQDCEERGIELVQVASGYRYQVKQDYSQWVSKLNQRRPPRYSRATLETLAMVAYEQPVTRSQIEEVRGVKTSGEILRSLRERGWVRELGHKQVPGLPILYGTTRAFLDYFNLRSLADLPPREEISSLLSDRGEVASE